MSKPNMTIVIRFDEGELHLDADEVPAVHLDDAIDIFTKAQVPGVINKALGCLRALCDEWNRHELEERAKLASDQKGD